MKTLDQVQAAQRHAPSAPETKSLQRAYAVGQLASHREAAGIRYLAEQARLKAELATLRLAVLAAGEAAQAAGVRDGFRLRYVTQGRAEQLMGAPAVLGGWIAVGLPRVRRGVDHYLAALLPQCMEYGLELAPLTLATQWAGELSSYAPDDPEVCAASMITMIRSIHAPQ